MKRLKILIVAYACSPVRGSEPGMGWQFVTEIAKHHDVWVIVEKEKFEREVEDEICNNSCLSKNIHFCFIEKFRARRLRKLWPPSYYWFYRAWHKDAYRLAQSLNREVGFDIFHQLNMVGFREPGYLWKSNIPFVWGPVGGLNQFPIRFIKNVGVYGAIHYIGRNVINFIQQHLSVRPRQAARKANHGLIAATSGTKERIKEVWGVDSQVICEIGSLASVLKRSPSQRNHGEPLIIAWSGLHIHRKALPLLLEALSRVGNDLDWQLNILGEGTLTATWKEMAVNLSIDKCCKWHGWLNKGEAVGVMSQSHVFIITSLSDLTSTVTLEALSLGLPIICLDHCGFSDVVTEECGIKIPVTSPSKVSQDIADAIEKIWKDERLRQRLSKGALKRVMDYTWEDKIKKINKIYQEVLENE